MTKEKIFELIDGEIEQRFGPECFQARDFTGLMSDDLKMKLLNLYEEDMYAAFGFEYDEAFEDLIIPEIERMYREERLDYKLECLMADVESEISRTLTEQSLMPGRV